MTKSEINKANGIMLEVAKKVSVQSSPVKRDMSGGAYATLFYVTEDCGDGDLVSNISIHFDGSGNVTVRTGVYYGKDLSMVTVPADSESIFAAIQKGIKKLEVECDTEFQYMYFR